MRLLLSHSLFIFLNAIMLNSCSVSNMKDGSAECNTGVVLAMARMRNVISEELHLQVSLSTLNEYYQLISKEQFEASKISDTINAIEYLGNRLVAFLEQGSKEIQGIGTLGVFTEDNYHNEIYSFTAGCQLYGLKRMFEPVDIDSSMNPFLYEDKMQKLLVIEELKGIVLSSSTFEIFRYTPSRRNIGEPYTK